MAQLGSLYTSLTLESSSFIVGLKKSADAAATNTAKIQQQLSGLTTGLKSAASLLGAGVFLSAASRALDYAGSLGETSQQLGITVRQLQVYRYAASQAGQSQEEMDNGLQKLTRTIGEAAAGSKTQADTFRDLGIAVRDTSGHLYTTGDLLPRIADALAKIKDPATRARIEVDLFGKAGQKLDPLLTQGAKGIKELGDQAEKAGIILSDKLADGADAAHDKLDALKMQLESNFAKLVAEHADQFANLAQQLMNAAGAAVQFANKYPAAIGVLGGAAIGGRVAGLPGALGGAGVGLMGAMYNRLNADPSQGLSDKELSGRMRQVSATIKDYQKNKYAVANDSGVFEVLKGLVAEGKALKAEADRRVALVKAGQAAMPALGDGALPSASGGRTKNAPKDKTDQEQEKFDKELASLQGEQIGLRQGMTSDLRDRARYEHNRIETEASAYQQELDSKVKLGQLTQAHADQLKLVSERNRELQDAAVNWKLDDDLAREDLQARDDGLTLQSELLKGQQASARTQAERRTIELQLLEIEYERQKASLEAVLALHSSTEAEKKIAQARLDQLPALKSIDQNQVRRQTAGPMEQYLDSIPKTAGEINEAFQQTAVDGLKSFNDGLVDAIVNSKSLGDVFKNVANQIVADLIRIALQAAESAIMGKQGSSGGGWLGAIIGVASAALGGGSFTSSSINNDAALKAIKVPGLASGGSFDVGGIPGTDQNMLSINGVARAKVSASERISVTPANDRERSGGSIVMHNDFRGADAAAVPRIEAKLDELNRSLEGRSVAAVSDAMDRRIIRRSM